jgi:hypothetical protein
MPIILWEPPTRWSDDTVSDYFNSEMRLPNVIIEKTTHYQRVGKGMCFRFRCTLKNTNVSGRSRQFWLTYQQLIHSHSKLLASVGFNISHYEDIYSDGWESDVSDGFQHLPARKEFTGSVHKFPCRTTPAAR